MRRIINPSISTVLSPSPLSPPLPSSPPEDSIISSEKLVKGVMLVKGVKTGQIRGDVKGVGVREAGRSLEGSIRIISLNYGITYPIDQKSGVASGKRIHSDVVLVKEIDSATVPLFNSFSEHERLSTVEFKLWKAGRYFGGVYDLNVKFSDCYITSINLYAGGSNMLEHHEQVSFVYDTVELRSPRFTADGREI
jgi:type VI secretion system Hcp family effector